MQHGNASTITFLRWPYLHLWKKRWFIGRARLLQPHNLRLLSSATLQICWRQHQQLLTAVITWYSILPDAFVWSTCGDAEGHHRRLTSLLVAIIAIILGSHRRRLFCRLTFRQKWLLTGTLFKDTSVCRTVELCRLTSFIVSLRSDDRASIFRGRVRLNWLRFSFNWNVLASFWWSGKRCVILLFGCQKLRSRWWPWRSISFQLFC